MIVSFTVGVDSRLFIIQNGKRIYFDTYEECNTYLKNEGYTKSHELFETFYLPHIREYSRYWHEVWKRTPKRLYLSFRLSPTGFDVTDGSRFLGYQKEFATYEEACQFLEKKGHRKVEEYFSFYMLGYWTGIKELDWFEKWEKE